MYKSNFTVKICFKIFLKFDFIFKISVDTNVFDNVNGNLLKELNEIKKTAPEFFYNMIRTKLISCSQMRTSSSKTAVVISDEASFSLGDLLKLSSELGDLFITKSSSPSK